MTAWPALLVTAAKIAGPSLAFRPLVVVCRILTRRENERLIVRLVGRLAEPQVADLMEVCGRTSEPPILELDELVSADAVGTDALSRIERQGAQLLGTPQYLRLTLDDLAKDHRR